MYKKETPHMIFGPGCWRFLTTRVFEIIGFWGMEKKKLRNATLP